MTGTSHWEDELMDPSSRDPRVALERLLALRPEDVEGWEEEAAAQLDPESTAALRAEDDLFDGLVSSWLEEDFADDCPDLRGSDFVGLAGAPSPLPEAVPLPVRRPRAANSGFAGWPQAAVLAAGLAFFCFAIWQLQQTPPPVTDIDPPLEGQRWKAVSGQSATQVELQFSVERDLGDGVHTEEGRRQAQYGPTDKLVLVVHLVGEGGWAYLLEQTAGGPPLLLHPSDGPGWQVEEGRHLLSSPDGNPLGYRPDALRGRARYLVLVTSEPVDAEALASQVVELGLDQPHLWPRAVRDVDSFEVDWIE